MATYTITINEKAKSGRALVQYLMGLDIVTKISKETFKNNIDKTLEAIKELDNGGGVLCDSYEDYLHKVNE